MPTENLLNTIVNNISDAIITIDAKGIIHTVNTTVEDMFGYSEIELIGKNINILMGKPYREMHDAYLARYLRTGKTRVIGKARELEALRKNGEHFEIELFIHDIGVDVEHRFLGIIRDISQRKHLDKIKSEFVSTVSHELRTPLTSIKGALGIINSEVLGELPPKLKNLTQLAHKNTERLILLVNDLLDVEKIQAGKIDLNFSKVNLTAVVKESIATNQTYASQLKVGIELADFGKDYFVKGDSNRLLQVMANLISNAAKYSPANEVIKITLTRCDNLVQVSVSDNGDGIPPEYRSKIFQKFSQIDASDRRQKGGTGLGLNITKAIVEYHGGTIDFISEVNKGATFFFKLPLWEAITETVALKELSEPLKQNRKNAGTILVLEDDPDIAALLTLMLEQHQFKVISCGLAAHAKQLLITQPFDLITVDIRLPDQDGLSFIKELRKDNQFKDLPIVIVSAEANLVKNQNITSGLHVIDWIEKPINQHRLLNSIDLTLLKHKQHSKILYIEDDADLAKIMTSLLGDEITVISVTTLEAAKETLQQEEFDLVILDIGLPDGTGLDILPVLQSYATITPVIIFSGNHITTDIINKVDAALIKSQATNDELSL